MNISKLQIGLQLYFRGICIEMLMQISALKGINLKLEICVFWINTNTSIKIITDTFIQLKIYFLMKISVYQID